MRRLIGPVVVAAAVLGACASEEPASCADLSGNWAVTSTRLSGTCDPKLDGDGHSTLSIRRAADGSYSVIFQGIEGECAARVDASCKLTTNCELKKDGKLVATVSLDYVHRICLRRYRGLGAGTARRTNRMHG